MVSKSDFPSMCQVQYTNVHLLRYVIGYRYCFHTDSSKFLKTSCCQFVFFDNSEGIRWASQIIKCSISQDFDFSHVVVRQHRVWRSFWSAAIARFSDSVVISAVEEAGSWWKSERKVAIDCGPLNFLVSLLWLKIFSVCCELAVDLEHD